MPAPKSPVWWGMGRGRRPGLTLLDFSCSESYFPAPPEIIPLAAVLFFASDTQARGSRGD